MSARPEIESLLRQVARRHDGFSARRVAIVTLIVASVLAIAVSLFWVLRGHSVPPAILLAIGATSLIGGLVYGWLRRMRTDAAVRETDRFFDLKDGIASARHLALHQPEDPATALQWKWLEPRLASCKAEAISENFPKRPALLAGLLAMAAIGLAFVPPSPAV